VSKKPVYIRGMGLASALGNNLPECVVAMQSGDTNSTELVLEGFDGDASMPYFRVADDQPLFARGRWKRLLTQVVSEALSAANLPSDTLASMPVFVGSTSFMVTECEQIYQQAMQNNPDEAYPLPMAGFQQFADWVAQEFAIGGESYTFNTACTASAIALMNATRMIQQGRFSQALVIGVELANLTTLSGFNGLQLVARELKPFDKNRAGLVLGEGLGAILLSAESGPDTSQAILAAACNCDTFSVTTANPDGSSIAAVIHSLLKQTGNCAADIVGIKAHGTASPLNDVGEAAGLRQVFARLPDLCGLKPYAGHTLGACGVIETILICAALSKGFFPATPGFNQTDEALGVEPTRRSVAAKNGLYLLDYFGFGGNNSVLLIENTI
jgi:3-oxoacyl-[acyl-carrier-protein] synthase-1